MRGNIHPYVVEDIGSLAVYDKIGSNSGNLMYAYGVCSAFSDQIQISMDQYKAEKNSYDDKAIQEINEQYDAYFLPLADAFRPDFENKINNLTRFIERLKIPVYVIGVGLHAEFEPHLEKGFPFDESVKRFVATVLKHSSAIGVRGAITQEYLVRLGFSRDKIIVIGCPSMYTLGDTLPYRNLNLNNNSRISINYGKGQPKEVIKYLNEIAYKYDNSQYVGQRLEELYTLWLGINDKDPRQDIDFPCDLSHPLYQDDKVRFFISANDWIANMQNVDFSVGTRLHGSIAAVLGGCPILLFTSDARTRELAEYHKFPAIPLKSLDYQIGVEELISKVDMETHIKAHKSNFLYYINFLKINGLEPNYNNIEIDSTNENGVKSILMCSSKEIISRINSIYKYKNEFLDKKIKYFKKALDEKNIKLNDAQKKISNMEKVLINIEELIKNRD